MPGRCDERWQDELHCHARLSLFDAGMNGWMDGMDGLVMKYSKQVGKERSKLPSDGWMNDGCTYDGCSV
jgi:hypothetical protein